MIGNIHCFNRGDTKYLDSAVQRVCTSRGEMGGGRLFFHVKLNLIDPCRTIRASTTVEGCHQMAGSPIAVYGQVQCREAKTGQEKVPLYCKDDLF